MGLIWPRLSLRHQVPAILALLLGASITLFMHVRARDAEAARIQLEFEMDARTGVNALQYEIAGLTAQLRDNVSLLACRSQADATNCDETFVKFASERRGISRQAMWIVHFDQDKSLAGVLAGNPATIPSAFDPAVVPGFADVLEGARNQGTAVSTPFVAGADRMSHAILLVASTAPPGSSSGPPNGYVGYVVGLKDLMLAFLEDRRDIGLDYVLRQAGMPEREAYRLDVSRMDEGAGYSQVSLERIAQLRQRGARDFDLHLAGTDWSVLVAPTLGYLRRMQTLWPYWVLAGGLLFSVLLADYLLVLLVKFADFERKAYDHASALTGANSELARQIALKNDVSLEVCKLTRAVECSPIGVVIAQPDGLIEYANQKCVELTGYDKAELEGRYSRVLEAGQMDEATQQAIQRTLAKGETWQGEIIYRRKDDEIVNFEASIAPVFNAEKEACNLIVLFSDVTARKRLEEQFLQSQKMEVIGRLAGGVVHDLSNMLTVILGFSQIVKSQLPEDDPLMEDIEEIIRVGEQAGALNRQLLAFARTRAHEAELVNLNDSIAEMDRFLVRTLGEDVVLTTLPGKKLGCITIDPGQIGQLIMNLAVNARDAMPGGGRLTIKTRHADPAPELRKLFNLADNEYVMLSVRDTGSGMSEQVRKHLFEPFFTTKAEGKGTGLGLSTVYGIVKQFNGAIEVDSEIDKGTEFKIYFPCCQGAAEDAGNIERVEVPRGSETILLVEDDQDVRQLCMALLEGLGYRVLSADSATQALEIAMRGLRDFDLLVTDVVMPEINGMELVDRLRKVRPDLKVIFTTGFSEHPVLNRGLVLDDSWMLSKPFTRDSLSRTVREALDAPVRVSSAAAMVSTHS